MGKKNTVLRVYRSYNFVNKDPVIDVVRTAVQGSEKSYAKIHALGGPTPSTLYNWFDGKTKRPQGCTLAATMLGIGGDVIYKMPDGNETSLKQLAGSKTVKVEPVKQKQSKADKIKTLHKAGYSIHEIKKQLRVGQTTIYAAIAREG